MQLKGTEVPWGPHEAGLAAVPAWSGQPVGGRGWPHAGGMPAPLQRGPDFCDYPSVTPTGGSRFLFAVIMSRRPAMPRSHLLSPPVLPVACHRSSRAPGALTRALGEVLSSAPRQNTFSVQDLLATPMLNLPSEAHTCGGSMLLGLILCCLLLVPNVDPDVKCQAAFWALAQSGHIMISTLFCFLQGTEQHCTESRR